MRYLFLITATTAILGAATLPANAHWLDWFHELRASFAQIGGSGGGGGSAVTNTSTNVIDCGNNNNNSPQQAACD